MATENNKSPKKEKYNSDLTKEERRMLDEENIHKDGGVDQQLRNRDGEIDFAGSDLDVPGRQDARKGHDNGLNDEENKVNSLGGPGKDNLKEQNGEI